MADRRRTEREVGTAPGRPVNEKRVGRLMREHNLQSAKAPAVSGRHQQHEARAFGGRQREGTQFRGHGPEPEVAGCPLLRTCRPTTKGWLYVALTLILFIPKFVGRAMSDPMPQELSAGLARSTSRTNPIRHRLAVGGYRKLLAARGITVSMSRKGDCWECANGRGQPQGEGRVRAGGRLQDLRHSGAGARRVLRLLRAPIRAPSRCFDTLRQWI